MKADCNWLLRSPETNEFDLSNVDGDWSIWTGVIGRTEVSIVCNECSSEIDCNLNGKCVDGECECKSEAGVSSLSLLFVLVSLFAPQYAHPKLILCSSGTVFRHALRCQIEGQLPNYCRWCVKSIEVTLFCASTKCEGIISYSILFSSIPHHVEGSNETYSVEYYQSHGEWGYPGTLFQEYSRPLYTYVGDDAARDEILWLLYSGSRWFGMVINLGDLNRTMEELTGGILEFHGKSSFHNSLF